MTTNTSKTNTSKSKPDTSTIEGVFTALLSGALTAHDAAIAADALSGATVKRTAHDTARTAWIIGMSADRQYVVDHGTPEKDGAVESVVKVAEHAVTAFGRSFEVTTVRNAISFSRQLSSLDILTMSAFDATFNLFVQRCTDRKAPAFKSDPKMYKVHASQFLTYVGRLNQPGRIDADGVVRAVVKGSVQRSTMASARKRQEDTSKAETAARLATITADGYKIGRVAVSSVIMLSKAERKDLLLLLSSLDD